MPRRARMYLPGQPYHIEFNPSVPFAYLKSGLVGLVTAGAFTGIHLSGIKGFSKVLAHGLVGGVRQSLSGGKFGAGFFAAAFTQSLSKKIRTIDADNPGANIQRAIAAAVVGGTASVIGGGKFRNGAVTGAFSRIFNDDYVAYGKA